MNKYQRYARRELHALQAWMRHKIEVIGERRLFRGMAYVTGPTCVQYAVVPVSHADRWPFARIIKPDVVNSDKTESSPAKNATVTEIKAPRRARNGA